jgi:hypothetical protein
MPVGTMKTKYKEKNENGIYRTEWKWDKRTE